jgi:hypothetical protein
MRISLLFEIAVGKARNDLDFEFLILNLFQGFLSISLFNLVSTNWKSAYIFAFFYALVEFFQNKFFVIVALFKDFSA